MYIATFERAGDESDLNYFSVTVYETEREAFRAVVEAWTDERVAEAVPPGALEGHERFDSTRQVWSAAHEGTTWVFTSQPLELGVAYSSELL